MITISLCMIVKDEEDVLGRCLDCAKQFADEIIIVDTGSRDKTKEIATAYTELIYDFEWCDDFSKARNFAFSKATKDYCMWLDADDIVKAEDIKKLQQLKQTLQKDMNIVMMKYHTAFDDQGNPIFTYYRERLINRDAHLHWEGAIHEVIPLVGSLQYADIAITHAKLHVSDPDRNIRIFESRVAKGLLLNAREQFYYARELYYHQRYEEAVQAFTSFLDSKEGWIENNIDACEMRGYCYYRINQEEAALLSFYQSFLYDVPRAELCCDIGQHYFDRQQIDKAIYWYECALRSKKNEWSGAFIREDCYGYLPLLQLCVCWYKLHDLKKAKEYNELAGTFKYTDTIKQNQQFFDNLTNEDHTEAAS